MPFRRAHRALARIAAPFLAALLAAVAAPAQEAAPPGAEPEFPMQPPAADDPTADEAEPSESHHPDEAPVTREERIERIITALSDPENGEHAVLQRRLVRLWSESGSDSMDLLLARGRAALEEEAYVKALDHFTALTELAPEFAEGWNARATAWYLNDEWWRAVADIQRTLAIEPRHFGALSGLGVILERTGDEQGALEAYRGALAVNPHLESAQDAVERLLPKVDGRDI